MPLPIYKRNSTRKADERQGFSIDPVPIWIINECPCKIIGVSTVSILRRIRMFQDKFIENDGYTSEIEEIEVDEMVSFINVNGSIDELFSIV